MKLIFSAGGVVFKKDPDIKILLIQAKTLQGNLVWQLPKGKIEANEQPEHAAVREVEEETGIKAQIVEKLHDDQYFFKHNNVLIKKRVYFFLMEYISGEPKPQDGEVEAVEWFSLDQVLDMVGYSKDVIKKALASLEKLAD